ncbi:MAG: cytochrome c biogenesis protein CcdA [Dehalococcoidia bacterium]|nr:cytochrome c biogenesis protein CcdA [Dehalococcoidia bacterium]
MPDVSFPVAFLAGLLSFLSPCVLPLVPIYLANIAGASVLTDTPPSRKHILMHTVFFIAGFSLIFIILGAAVGLLGAMLPFNLLNNIAGALLIAFGVFLLASRKIPWLNYETRLNLTAARGSGYLRSLSIGAIFALGWTPCVGPILAGVLALAWNSQTVWQGIYLLLAYCIGLGLPFIIIGLAIGAASRPIKWLSRHSFITLIVSAALLIIIGILMLTGNLGYLSSI